MIDFANDFMTGDNVYARGGCGDKQTKPSSMLYNHRCH